MCFSIQMTIWLLLFIFVFNPSDSSLAEDLGGQMPYGKQTIAKILISMESKINNYGFFKIATISMNNNNLKFLGFMNNWIYINTNLIS